MPFTAKDVETMPARGIDYAIAQNLLGWQRVTPEDGGLPPGSTPAIANFRPIPLFTNEHEPANQVRAWLEQNHPWRDESGIRAPIVADHDSTAGLYAACALVNQKDPQASICAHGETLLLAYGRLALIAWLQLQPD